MTMARWGGDGMGVLLGLMQFMVRIRSMRSAVP
jgi:hypothetical protein